MLIIKSMKKILIFILCVCVCFSALSKEPDSFKLNLIHTNDLHSHLLPFNDLSDCSMDSDCLGGFARIITFMEKEKSPISLFLDAGDRFTGTAFYTLFKSKFLLPLFQKMPYDAINLGNHEFDDNLSETVSFLKKWPVPVVVANLKINPKEDLFSLVKPSIVIEKENRKIGIIGLLTQETMVLGNEDISVLPFSDALTKEIESLKKQGVNIIIVLSHIGIDEDKKLAQQFPDIDSIVGGHSHSLLSNDSSISYASGPYPISEGKTLIVSAGMGGRFVGKLEADFNMAGEIIKYRGNTIPMNNQIPNNPAAERFINEAQKDMNAVLNEQITTFEKSFGFTPGTDYCSENCAVGTYLAETLHSAYPSVDGVLLNAGAIRRGFAAGPVSYRDLIEAYPFDNDAVLIQLTGKELKEYLAHGIAKYHKKGKTNEMLQTAGVKYDFSKEDKKITKVEINGKQIQPDKTYTFLTSSFLANGGDKYPKKAYQKVGHTVREILKSQMRKSAGK